MLVRGTAGDTLPTALAASSARWPGSSATPRTRAQALVQDYRRAARRARAVMDRLFYG